MSWKHFFLIKFKIIFLFMVGIVCSPTIQAQVDVPYAKARMLLTKEKIFELDDIKDIVTYFIVPDLFSDATYNSLEKEISEIWQLGEIKFMRAARAEKKSFIEGKTAFINITGLVYITDFGRTSDYSCYLQFSIHRKGVEYPTKLAKIYLYLSIHDLLSLANRYGNIEAKDLTQVSSNEKGIIGLSVGNIKNCLVYAQKEILNERHSKHNIFVTKDQEVINKLKSTKLSIPDYILLNNSPRQKGKLLDSAKLFKGFEVPFVLKTNDQINSEILSASSDYFYMNVVCDKNHVTYTVWNAYTNEILLWIQLRGRSASKAQLNNIRVLLQ